MDSTHTPGPWMAGVPASGRGGGVNVVAAGGAVAMVYDHIKDGGNPSRDADARLIAAAPDLLAACIAIAEVFGIPADGCEGNPHAIQVRAAIAKATGSEVSA